MSFMPTRQGQTLWMLPLSQTRGTEEEFMGEGGRVVPPLGTAEALHTGPWSGLAVDRTQRGWETGATRVQNWPLQQMHQ